MMTEWTRMPMRKTLPIHVDTCSSRHTTCTQRCRYSRAHRDHHQQSSRSPDRVLMPVLPRSTACAPYLLVRTRNRSMTAWTWSLHRTRRRRIVFACQSIPLLPRGSCTRSVSIILADFAQRYPVDHTQREQVLWRCTLQTTAQGYRSQQAPARSITEPGVLFS